MRRPETRSPKLMLALVMATAAACQVPTSPDQDPAPPPTPELRHNADVVLRRIDIEGACDGNDIFGDPKDGQFAFRIDVYENSVSGNGKHYTRESTDYGDLLGQTYLRGPGESIDLNDRTYAITALSQGESVTVSFRAIEWDIVVRDSRMDGSGASQKRAYPGDGKKYYELNLGSGSCKVQLEYAIVWSTP